VLRRCVWSRNIKNGCSIYIYDISHLKVNDVFMVNAVFRRHTKFRPRGITQKKTYNIQNTAEVWNQEI